MRWFKMAVLALTVPVAVSQAQRPSRVELGTMLGVTILSANGDTEVLIGAPGGGTLFGLLPVFYANLAVTPNVTVEPQTYFAHSDGETVFSGVVQVAYLAVPRGRASPFIAAHGGLLHMTGADISGMLGASLGYRFIVNDALAIRLEGRYRRWLDSEVNDIGLLVGFGVRLP